jgi:hypothetical protein
MINEPDDELIEAANQVVIEDKTIVSSNTPAISRPDK